MTSMLTVCGSLQRRSTNRLLLQVATAAAVPDAVVVDFEGLRHVAAFDPDEADDPDGPTRHWLTRAAEADVVLFACPEYAGALGGTLKNALEWTVGASTLYRKPVAVMSSGTSGGSFAIAQMIQTLTWQGAHVVGTLGVASPRTKIGTDATFTDRTTIDAVAALTHRLLRAPSMPPDERMAFVVETVTAAGVGTTHIAPVE